MFEKINRTLPAESRSSVFSFYSGTVYSPFSLFSRSPRSSSSSLRCDTLFASHVERSHYNEREQRGAKGQDDSGGLNAHVKRSVEATEYPAQLIARREHIPCVELLLRDATRRDTTSRGRASIFQSKLFESCNALL